MPHKDSRNLRRSVHEEDPDEALREKIASAVRRGDRGRFLRDWRLARPHTSSFQPSVWVQLVRASTAFADASLFREVWAASEKRRGDLDAITWSSFATAAGRHHDAETFREIVRLGERVFDSLSGRDWSAWFTAAGNLRLGGVLEELWSASVKVVESRTDPAAAALVIAEESYWGAAAKAAGQTQRKRLLPKIWEKARLARREGRLIFSPRTVNSFVTAAGDIENDELVLDIWNEMGPEDLGKFDQRVWGALANAAGSIGDRALFDAIWVGMGDGSQDFGLPTWSAFAHAAAGVGRGDIVRRAWNACRQDGARFDGRMWATFVFAARRVDDRKLLREIWEGKPDEIHATDQATDASTFPIPVSSWHVLLDAASSIDHELAEEAWFALMDDPTKADALTPGNWCRIARAAARLVRPDILEAAWRRVRSDLRRLDAEDWGHLVHATCDMRWSVPVLAGNDVSVLSQRDQIRAMQTDPLKIGLLSEIWDGAQPHLEKLHYQVWEAFLRTAVDAGHWDLLGRVFDAFVGRQDRIRHARWGPLGPALIDVESRCEDAILRTRMRETLRGQRIDLDEMLRTLAETRPAGPSAKAGRFEGASRCLMRFLIMNFVFAPNSYEEGLARIGTVVRSLPPDTALRAWMNFVGRGQDAYTAAFRARFADELAAVSRIGMEPVVTMEAADQDRILMDLRNLTPDGLIARLGRFIRQEGRSLFGAPRTEVRGRVAAIATFVEDNLRDYLEGTLDPARSGGYFARLAALGDDAQEELASPLGGETLVRATIEKCLVVSQEIHAQSFAGQAHDLLRTLGKEQALRLTAYPESPQVEMAALTVMVDMVRAFERSIRSPIEVDSTSNPVNLRTLLSERIGLRHPVGRTVEIDVPDRCYVLVPQGLRERSLIPALASIRQNAESALATLPPERQWFRCAVREDAGWMNVTIENNYAAGVAPRVDSSGVGLPGIRRRIVEELGGTMIWPPVNDRSRDPAVWRIEFELRAGPNHPGAVPEHRGIPG